MMPRRLIGLLIAVLPLASTTATAGDAPRFIAQEIDSHIGKVCYAVTTADVNGDGKLDVVAISEDALIWYENPTWTKRDIVRGLTVRDNVAIQAHDIDGDGRIDFSLGAGWRPPDTTQASTLQWVGRDAQGAWQIHPIRFDEPSMHRMRWGRVSGKVAPQLVVAPLQGRGTKGPNWGEGTGVKVLVLDVPADPTQPDWPVEVADDSLHTIHNLWLANLDADDRDEILIAAWEGVFALDRGDDGRWKKIAIGSGNTESRPYKGASEVKLGVSVRGGPFVATIEPWHGNQVVVYTPPELIPRQGLLRVGGLFNRQVIAEPLAWGHAVWCADTDNEGDDEIIVGQRDANPSGPIPRGPGVYLFDSQVVDNRLVWTRHTIDDGGMACEDLVAADLDKDGRIDIIAGGRGTQNVKIYWNRPTR